MSLIHLKSIISCSSEDRVHSAKNLLHPNPNGDQGWLSSKGGEDRITCVLEFDKSVSISSIEIGNDGSAFIEILVSNGDEDWTLLLPVTSLMTPKESRSDLHRNQKKVFQGSDFEPNTQNKEWQRVKLICLQKFNSKPFGLQFIKFYTSPKDNHTDDEDDEDETRKEQSRIGSYFARKQAEKTLTSSEPERKERPSASSNVATELLKRKSTTETDSSLPSKKSTSTNKASPAKESEKSPIMKNVVFVLSGFQNPLRSELRTKATSMGATYRDDWDDQCTHLICAFPNTPKFVQVQHSGRGSIVSQKWILDCCMQNRLLPEIAYSLKGDDENVSQKKATPKKKREPSPESEPELEVAPTPKRKTPVKKKSLSKKDEEDRLKQGDLPAFFRGMHFYVSYGDFSELTLLDIIRVLLAYDGAIERQIDKNVDYVITKRLWNPDFEKIVQANPKIKFVSIDWLQDCHDQNALALDKPHLITPLV